MKEKFKKLAKGLILTFLFINLALTIAPLCTAATDLDTIGGQTGLPSMTVGQHPESPVDYKYEGVGTLGSTAYFLMDLFKFLLSGIAVLVIISMGVRMIASGSNEEEVKKVQKGLGIAIAGLILIQLADVLVKKVFFGEYGEVLEDKTSAEEFATEGTAELRGIIGMIQTALGAIAMLVIIINGIKIMVSGGEEENRKKALKNVGVAAGGLVVVLLSEVIVKGFVFPEYGEVLPHPGIAKGLFVMVTNFISGFLATISFVMLLVAGYMYVVSGGEEQGREKVKKLILGAVIGLIIALGAYAIANTLITFQEENEYIPESGQVEEVIK
jgi:hypothetical protein